MKKRYKSSPSGRRQKLHQALTELVNFETWTHPTAVTLTQKRSVTTPTGLFRGTPEMYSQNLRHFLNCLERVLLTRSERRGRKHLRVLAALETDQSGRPHYHLMIERPAGCTAMRFFELITSNWRKTVWGAREVDVRPAETSGWIDYIAKREFVSDEPAIDWHISRF
jgi:hypothetical protein